MSAPPPSLVSVHDVSPVVMPSIMDILSRLKHIGVSAVTLLVIPGCRWSREDLARLKALQENGYRMAGHGWLHRSVENMTAGHRLHSRLLSRYAAEHLSRPSTRVVSLIQDSFEWFRSAGLTPPDLYVPPAWAMGRLPRRWLKKLPYRYYETVTGVYDSSKDEFHPLPLAGFEADTRLRVSFLRVFNNLNTCLAQLIGRPLRIAIHPHDFRLGLADRLTAYLEKSGGFLEYADLGRIRRRPPPQP